MYLFVRGKWGARPALVAAVAYVYAPYIQYVDPYARGVLAESFSFALFPWVLWAFARLLDSLTWQKGRTFWPGRRIGLAAVLLAALICTHNLMALVLTAILAAWVLWQTVVQWVKLRSLSALIFSWPLWLALTLGVALAAFFWLPVALERDAVQLANLVSDGGHFDFHNHFLSLGELFAPTPLLDLGATEPRYLFNLGLAQWVLALIGGTTLFQRETPYRPRAIFFALAALALGFLLLPISGPVWERVPFMPFLQFPWRLLGPLLACLSVLAGLAATAAERLGKRGANLATAGLVFLIVLLGLPLTFPAEWSADFGRTDAWGIVLAERGGRWLGTTSTGDYVPADVIVVPKPQGQLIRSYEAGGLIDRVNHATIPEGASVRQVVDEPLRWVYQIDGDESFVFRLFHFYFPGWTATLDGQPAPIEPAEPDGFMTVKIPSGPHTLEIAFHDTSARTIAWVVSGLALLVGLFLVARRPGVLPAQSPHSQASISYSLLFIPLALLAFKLLVAGPLGWFRLESTGFQVARVDHAVFYRVGEEIALIGYDWEPAEPGDTAQLTLYWKALAPISTNYQVFVHLRDASGAVAAQADKLNPGDYPTQWWPLDKYVRDPYEIVIPAELPPGRYDLAVGLWLMAEGTRIPVHDEAGRLLADSIFLETQNY